MKWLTRTFHLIYIDWINDRRIQFVALSYGSLSEIRSTDLSRPYIVPVCGLSFPIFTFVMCVVSNEGDFVSAVICSASVLSAVFFIFL